MITKEEFKKVVECCTSTVSCENCPLSEKDLKCGVYLAEYLKENEPAPAATGTSSEVSVKEDTDNIQFNGSTKEQICQAYDTADKACADILDIYEGMPACERRAFDIGEAYGKIFSTRDKLEKLRGAN